MKPATSYGAVCDAYADAGVGQFEGAGTAIRTSVKASRAASGAFDEGTRTCHPFGDDE